MARYRDDDEGDDRPARQPRDDNRDRDDDRPRRRSRDDRDDRDDRPQRSRRDNDGPSSKRVSVLGVFALIIAVPSLIMAFVPCMNVFAIGSGLLAALLGIIGMVTAKGSNGQVGSGLPLTGLILGALPPSSARSCCSCTWPSPPHSRPPPPRRSPHRPT